MSRHVVTRVIGIVSLAALGMPASAVGASHRPHVREVELRDDCDPATFDEAIGPGTCIEHSRGRGVTFAEFVDKLNPQDFGHPKWRNRPSHRVIRADDSLEVVVRGGEFHTFTEVDEFGPGCVAFINAALGLTDPAPTQAECDSLSATTGVLPGETLTVAGLDPGEHYFMCLIHPWMRTEIDVKSF
jgi:hypothetical protein